MAFIGDEHLLTTYHPRIRSKSLVLQRQNAKTFEKVAGASTSADLFKSPFNCPKPKSKQWDHYLNRESGSRQPSHLKKIMSLYAQDTISVCGGLPSSQFFPFERLALGYSPITTSESEKYARPFPDTISTKSDITEGSSSYDLSVALNYGQSQGPPQLLRWITEHVEMTHNPPYEDWDIILTSGNTMGIDVAVRMFAGPGTAILTEAHTYSSAIQAFLPLGIKPIGVPMDEQGILPTELDNLLSSWDQSKHGAPKPFLLYTIPTGQNPTGITTPLRRKHEIYAIAEKHDLILLEDDPYFFLQFEPLDSQTRQDATSPLQRSGLQQYISNLQPSYLSIDQSGRVLRLDSFSKIISPGARVGWMTGSNQLVERCVRHIEQSSQSPSGFSMLALYNLLDVTWGHEGFWHWLVHVQKGYTTRRNIMVNACRKYLRKNIVSFELPSAGMFVWFKVDVTSHPRLQSLDGGKVTKSTLDQIEESIFLTLASHKVLVARGSWFSAGESEIQNPEIFFRMSFASASEEQLEEAVVRFAAALKTEFIVS